MSETPQRVGVLERGLLIGGKSVSASSGKHHALASNRRCLWAARTLILHAHQTKQGRRPGS